MCRNAMGDENRIIRLKQSCSNDQTVEVTRQKVAVCDLKKATFICAIDYWIPIDSKEREHCSRNKLPTFQIEF